MEPPATLSVAPVAGPGHALTELAASELAELVGSGEVSAEEVLAVHLARVAEVDPEVHALVHVDAEGALQHARELDRRRLDGEPVGPLSGVPFVVKDNLDVGGQTTSAGSRAPEGVIAMRDAVVVRRLRAAGAVLIGRANMDELAMGASTDTSAFGATCNPRDPRRSPGGSSGGSAAAVAAHLVPVAVGTDTGGSIREPAAQCGVVGMAPTHGLVARRGLVPFAPAYDRIGPLARTVGDTARLLAVMAGRPDLAAPAAPEHRPRLGLVREMCGPVNHPGVIDRLRSVAAGAQRLGWDLVDVSVPEAAQALSGYLALTSAACVPAVEPYVRTGRVGAEVLRRWELGRRLLGPDAEELEAARALQHRLTAAVRDALAGCEALLTPTMPTTAPVVHRGADLTDPLSTPYTDCWTVLANMTGLAAVSIPAGPSPDDGMPVGVQLAAGPGTDAALLGLAAALSAAG